jgi:hypothetical protein
MWDRIFKRGQKWGIICYKIHTHTHTSICNLTNEGHSIENLRGWVGLWSVSMATSGIALSPSESSSLTAVAYEPN